MQVAGITTQQEAYVVSDDMPFKINQMLIIEDKSQGNMVGEIVETSSYNRYIPLSMDSGLVDAKVIESLRKLGYKIDDNTLFIAKVRLVVEAEYPIETGASVRFPSFYEVKSFLVRESADEGLVLGVIKSTEELVPTMDEGYRNLCSIFYEGKICPQNGVPFIFDIKSMQQYPHIGIFGGSGSGKSFCMRVILEELMKLRIPTVVLDPHYEMDFSETREGSGFGGRFRCLQIGQHIGVNFTGLNTRDLISLIGAASAGNLTESMCSAIEQLHRHKDSYQTFSDRLNFLREALDIGSRNKLQALMDEASNDYDRYKYSQCMELLGKYGSTPPASVNGVVWRLNRLYREGLFNNDIIPVENCLKSGMTAVVQGPIRLLNVFSTYLMSNLYYKRREYKDSLYKNIPCEYFPPFLLSTDECHNFAPKGYEAPSKSIIKEIAQEGRKYGVFLVLATQRPTLLDETITAQLNSKFVLRTVRASDIDTIREETDITSEEAKRLPYLRSGDAFVSSAIFGRTMLTRMRMALTDSPHSLNPFDELRSREDEEKEKFIRAVEEYLPLYPTELSEVAVSLEAKGYPCDVDRLLTILQKLVEDKRLMSKKTVFGEMYDRAGEE